MSKLAPLPQDLVPTLLSTMQMVFRVIGNKLHTVLKQLVADSFLASGRSFVLVWKDLAKAYLVILALNPK